MPGLTVRRHVWVAGRVQGVFFRATCQREARERGVDGWVRNLPDRRVEAVFEGPPEAVDALIAWCRTGPAGARIDGVEIAAEPPAGETGFQVY